MKIFNVSPEDRYEEQSDLFESTSFEDYSLSSDVIDCLIDGIHEYGKIEIDTIHSIYESKEDIVSIDESVSDMFGKFKEWILNLLKRIKRLIERFLSKFDVWFAKSSLTQSSLSRLKDFNKPFDYKYGYKFAFNNRDTPMKPLEDIRDNIKDIAMFCNNHNTKDINKLTKDIKGFMKEKMFEDKEAFIDQQRGKIFNISNNPTYIKKSGYFKFLKAHFRNGDHEPKIVHVDKAYINDIIKNSGNDWYKSFKNQIKAEEKMVRTIYTTITQYIDAIRKRISLLTVDPVDETDYDNLYTTASIYLTNLISVTKEINNDVMLYYSAKRDAVKAMAFQNNKIASRALGGVM